MKLSGHSYDGALPRREIDDYVKRVLAEDLGEGGDVTSRATIDAGARFVATMNCREPIVVAGIDLAEAFFRALDPRRHDRALRRGWRRASRRGR